MRVSILIFDFSMSPFTHSYRHCILRTSSPSQVPVWCVDDDADADDDGDADADDYGDGYGGGDYVILMMVGKS